MDEKPLSDEQVWSRLNAAQETLGSAPGSSKVGDAALKAARTALVSLQMAVLKSSEDGQQVKDREPNEP